MCLAIALPRLFPVHWLWLWGVPSGRIQWQGLRYVPDLNTQPMACFWICLISAAPFFIRYRQHPETRHTAELNNSTCQKVIGVFSMKPLLAREGLLVPCFVCTMIYVGASAVSYLSLALSPDPIYPSALERACSVGSAQFG